MHLGCGEGRLERRRPYVDADPLAAGALDRQAEESQWVPHRGQVAPATPDVTQQPQGPARYPVGCGASPDGRLDRHVVHRWYGFLAWIALLTISATLRSVKDRGSWRSRSVKSLRASSTVGSSLSSMCSRRLIGTCRHCRRVAISSRL